MAEDQFLKFYTGSSQTFWAIFGVLTDPASFCLTELSLRGAVFCLES